MSLIAALPSASPADNHWYAALNPFHYLGSAAGKVVADGWTAAMLGLWNAGLWMLRLVLNVMDGFLTPDLNGDGPGHVVYQTTFWIAGALVVALGMIQLGIAAFRRDGRSLATVLIGVGQFAIVWSAWIAYGAAVVAACGGLTHALMQSLLNVNSWSHWAPWSAFTTDDITDGTVATVLGMLGMVLWLAAIGHLLVMLARAAALMVLVATTPISAAGLVGDAGRSWFWKSLRWFHAAAFTPVLTVLVLGLGIQMTTGVAAGLADDKLQQAIGTAVPGVMLILISCLVPLALFKLLAFVDPTTSSGAGMRMGLAANGGIGGLLSGGGGAPASGTSSAASSTDASGRAEGESSAEDATTQRFSGVLAGAGAIGQTAAKALGGMASVGAKGAAVGSDLTNQMGVGHHAYHPDFTNTGQPSQRTQSNAGGNGGGSGGGPGGGDTDPAGATNDDGREPTPDAPVGSGDPTPALPGSPTAPAAAPAPPGSSSAPGRSPSAGGGKGGSHAGTGGVSGGGGAAGGDAAAAAAL